MKVLPIFLAINSAVVFLGTSKDIESLQHKYGVSIEPGWMNYSITVNVHDAFPEIASAPISASPADLDKQLQKLCEEKMKMLESAFGIKIGKSGTVHETAYGQMHQTAQAVPVKAPNLGELCILEYALKHSSPSQLVGVAKKSSGVNIYFLDDKKPLSATEWGFDNKNKPSLFVEPRRGVTFGHTLEENLMHQLAHNSEFRMGWNPYESWRWPMATKLGWVFGGDPTVSDVSLNGNFTRVQAPITGWLLRSEEGPNYLYKQAGEDLWVRCDKSFRYLDDSGKPASLEKARKFSSEKVREFALIKPVSPDFPTPPEVFADALAMFKADRDARGELLLESPRLYNIVREHDQKELDATYGKGVKIRSVDGLVCDPTEKVLKEIRELEGGKAS